LTERNSFEFLREARSDPSESLLAENGPVVAGELAEPKKIAEKVYRESHRKIERILSG
jgi:hypothetical protein